MNKTLEWIKKKMDLQGPSATITNLHIEEAFIKGMAAGHRRAQEAKLKEDNMRTYFTLLRTNGFTDEIRLFESAEDAAEHARNTGYGLTWNNWLGQVFSKMTGDSYAEMRIAKIILPLEERK